MRKCELFFQTDLFDSNGIFCGRKYAKVFLDCDASGVDIDKLVSEEIKVMNDAEKEARANGRTYRTHLVQYLYVD